MSEDTSESYESGDVVWVKLGSSWWPGEVKNAVELPTEALEFKKPPLVIVKFFDEDSYEYVKTWANIFPYNCEKKNEFIKKGMAAYRAKSPHMEKFPKDVLKAEEKLGGNPNILSDPMFLPEKKRNYAAEVFGTPSPKSNSLKNKRRSNTKSSSKRDTSHITHRRFLGVDDYRAYICIQYPGKDKDQSDSEYDEVIRINREPEQDFNCHSCSFTTKRLEVMILHTKSHIQGVYLSSTRKNKQSVSRKRKEKTKWSAESDSSDSEPVQQKKKKPKSQGSKKPKIKKTEEEKEPPKKDIRSELLEAWEDSDEEEELGFTTDNKENSKTFDLSSEAVPELTLEESTNKSEVNNSTNLSDKENSALTEIADEVASRPEVGAKVPREEAKSPTKTIEEALSNVSGELEEEQPQNKPKPEEEHLSTENLLSTLEDDSTDFQSQDDKEKEVEDDTASDKKEEEAPAQKSDLDEDISKQKMDKDIHEAIKSCFDFDEDEEEDSTIVSKAASGRKIPRVIPKVPRNKSAEEKEKVPKESNDPEDIDAAFKELMDITTVPELPEVQNNLKCEQNFHNIKTIKFPDKPESVGSPPKKEPIEASTKLINPKKRFVKSFEDFENEIRRREEESKNERNETDCEENKKEVSGSASKSDYVDSYEDPYSPDSTIELSKLKSKIMSKIMEEAKIHEESKIKIMAKIKEPKHKTAESEEKSTNNTYDKEKLANISTSHRTPRSKILESYRNDTNKHKVEEKPEHQQKEEKNECSSAKSDEKIEEQVCEKEIVPPKKNKWSRRGSHPKKDKNLFLLQETIPEIQTNVEIPKETVEEPVKNEIQVPVEVETDSTSIASESHSKEDLPKDTVPEIQTHVEISKEVVEEVPKNDSQVPVEVESIETSTKADETVIEEANEAVNEETASTNEVIEEEKLETTVEEVKATVEEVEEAVEDAETTVEEPEAEKETIVEEIKATVTEAEAISEEREATAEAGATVEAAGPTVEAAGLTVEAVEATVEAAEATVEAAEATVEAAEATVDTISEPEITEIETLQFDNSSNLSKEDDFIVELPKEETKEDEKLCSTNSGSVQIEEIPPDCEPLLDVKVVETPEEESSQLVKEPQAEVVEEVTSEPIVEEEPLEEVKLPAEEEKQKDPPQEDAVKENLVVPEDISLPVEEPVAQEEDIPLQNKEEEESQVPLNETESIDKDKSHSDIFEPEESKVVEETTLESVVSESYTISNDFITTMPEDIMVTSPKQSKKRKISEDNLIDDPVKTVESVELQSDEFKPLEKRRKEEATEEDVKSVSPLLESIESDVVPEKTNEEVVLENQPATDISESIKCDDNMDVEETREQNKEIVEETVLETNEVVEEEKIEEEIKLDKEATVPLLVDDVVKETEEVKEDKVEEELKSMETEEVPPEKLEEETVTVEPEHNNEVEIQCASSSMDSFKFSIQTNLSILSSREEMSALALATLSEIKADLESSEGMISKAEPKPEHPIAPPVLLESEMVPIEGNLTVVSEKDLADGQVEITSEQVISPKRPATMSNFSMDFSDSLSDSNSNSTTDTSCDLGKSDFSSKGTEFTSKAFTKQMKKVDQKKQSTYGRLELLNILEGNSDSEKKPKGSLQTKKSTFVDDICDFEEHIPSQIVCAKALKKEEPDEEKRSKTSVKSTTSKLLERLTTESKAKASAMKFNVSDIPLPEPKSAGKSQNMTPSVPKSTKYIVRPKSSLISPKPVVLSEQIVKPTAETSKVKPKKVDNIEDVEAFVIHKEQTKTNLEEEPKKSKSTKASGKAKILQQTIITPAGEIIQPTVSEAQVDDNIFDINSMPIVLSDDFLTPESIEKMPIVIGSDAKSTIAEKVVKKPPSRIITTVATPPATPNKTITITKHKQPRILQSFSNKAVKNSPLLPSTAKPGKYIIVPQSSIPQTKYVPKKPTIVKKPTVPSTVVPKVPNIAPEPSGNKIMIVTNQQGQQQRLLLTPAQQKMLGYQNQKVTKTIVKGNMMQKSVLATKSVPLIEAGTSGVVSKSPSLIGQKILVGANQGLITTTSHQVIGAQGRVAKTVSKRASSATQKASGKPQKTILIKNQHGQTVRRIQGTDDELLDKQVAEQLEAIKASSGMKFSPQQKLAESGKTTPKTPTRRSYSKRVEVKPRGPPPLAGITKASKPETVVSFPSPPVAKKVETTESKTLPVKLAEETKTQQQPERPLNQLVIQDAVGNQTTITEGQILALPSETVDGQPQSYMLVTLDESGNLTPLNSEALMSLDPNLGLGGDLSNMVLQIDQGTQQIVVKPPEATAPVKAVATEVETAPQPVPEAVVTQDVVEAVPEQKVVPATEPLQTTSTNGEPGQQLIVTGDPIATQKFLESLTEGTTDLANILANAEGNSILIQADGQQILINTNTDNQMLLSMNNEGGNVSENTEGGGNPIFATQPSKNQDILAAALADTDVFQPDHPSSSQSKIGSQLSPNNTLYPMNVGNVLETSLTLSSPIMTPLEVPSTNSKKIPDDEADILTQVPKNVDLPITITDPNISQTVANQQVSAMIANELHSNLELALPISETTISAVSTGMNSPSYVYSLPALDDSVEIAQKPFNGSMPLLNEDVDEAMDKKKAEETKDAKEGPGDDKKKREVTFLAEEEGRFTLGGEMCSSLSEPPPEMFELPEVGQNFSEKSGSNDPSLQSTPDVSDNASKDDDTTDLSQADTSSEGSCEIPLQPQIVTKSLDLSRDLDSLKRGLSEEEEGQSKKCKFD